VGGLIFEELDRRTLTNALAQDNIVLGADHQHLVRTLLSNPSQALQVLGTLTPGLERKILPMFKDSFMAGDGGAMWHLLATCAIGAVLVPLAMKPVNQRMIPRVRPATAGPFAALNRSGGALRQATSRAEPQRQSAATTSSNATISQKANWWIMGLVIARHAEWVGENTVSIDSTCTTNCMLGSGSSRFPALARSANSPMLNTSAALAVRIKELAVKAGRG
jgi:hypothetical protein